MALLIGYPAAYALAQQPKNRQMALLVLVMLPFWSNYLIRTYAWIVLLNSEGLINGSLEAAGVIDEPLPCSTTSSRSCSAWSMTTCRSMILALYSSISRLGPELREASFDLGGSAWTTFRRVTLPLTVPGIAAGAVFVFVLSIGNFVTPELLGGGQRPMLGNLIYAQYLSARDWPMGRRSASSWSSSCWRCCSGRRSCRRALRARARRGWRRSRRGRGMIARDPIRLWLNAHLGLVYIFLYVPILVLIVLSFNKSGLPTAWTGFSTEWYGKLIANPKILSAAGNSLIVAVVSTIIATAIGTLLAMGLEEGGPNPWLDALVAAPMIIPDIVLAIALLSFYTLLNMSLGLHSIVLSHAVFNIAFVAMVVRTRLKNFDKSIVEASIDLGASEFTTFRRVTLPVIAPGVIAAALAGIHPLDRRIHHRLFHRRRGAGLDHLPDADLRHDPLRRDAGDQRHRHHRDRLQLFPGPAVAAAQSRGGGMSLLQIDGITKRFGPVTAVDKISLEVKDGEFFAILGPSGCGKTTLLRVIAGFEAPDEGRVRLAGRTSQTSRPIAGRST